MENSTVSLKNKKGLVFLAIKLSDHFTYSKLLRFTLSSIVMMIFTSIYSVVDGLFVSNFVGKTPFAAINLIFPLLMILGALGFVFGTGGTAIVSKTLGEGKQELANRYFSMLVYVAFIGGVILAVIGELLAPTAARLLGAEGEMLKNCVLYARIILMALPFFILQNVFQSFFVTAEKPHLGLMVTVAAGLTNMIFDALFIAVFRMGLAGAAFATALSQTVGGLFPLIYFGRKNNTSILRLTRTSFSGRVLLNTCINGSSELMSNISSSVVTMLYNFQLMRLAGENGVAAYGAIMYVGFIFAAIFFGYAIGSAPIVGFHYGAGNTDELKNLFRKSFSMMVIGGVVMLISSFLLASPLSQLFVGYDRELYEITVHGFKIFAFSYLITGVNVYGSAFFTALNNGLLSALISFLRTLVFQVLCIMTLPYIFDLDGVWYAVIAAELLSLIVTVSLLIANRKRYQYA